MYQRKITHLTLIKQQLQIQDGYHSMTLFDIGKMNTWEKKCICHSHHPVLLSCSWFVTRWFFYMSSTAGTTSGIGTSYSSDLSSSPVFSGVYVAQSLVFCVVFYVPLFVFLSFSFRHCIYCLSFDLRFLITPSILLWYCQTFFISEVTNLIVVKCI